LLNSINSSDKAAQQNGGVGSDWQMTEKPVAILKGLNHSDFCPGFEVPGDIFPSDISDKLESNKLIGEVSAAFLHLHTEQTDEAVKDAALTTIKDQSKWTREELMGPYKSALTWEAAVEDGEAPWCQLVQPWLPGFKNLDDYNKMQVTSVYKNDSHDFEDTRVSYSKTDSEAVVFNVSGHNQYYRDGPTGILTSCLYPAHEIGCKMASADRAAEQLNVDSSDYEG
jgi:hypothetical protein